MKPRCSKEWRMTSLTGLVVGMSFFLQGNLTDGSSGTTEAVTIKTLKLGVYKAKRPAQPGKIGGGDPTKGGPHVST